MSLSTSARLATLCAACLAMAGCGQTPAPLGAAAARAPRRLELPANIRPIPLDVKATSTTLEPTLAPAQYQQTYAPPASGDSRIVEISSQAPMPPSGSIREPAAALSSATGAPPAPPRRSQFVPISVPQPSTAPQLPPPPHLPSEPAFSLAQPNPYVTQPVEPLAARAPTAATLPPPSTQIADRNFTPAQPPESPAIQSLTVQP